jgi:hypothetical protein
LLSIFFKCFLFIIHIKHLKMGDVRLPIYNYVYPCTEGDFK